MPSEDRESDVSEMREEIDSVSGGTSEVLSDVSEYGLEYNAQEIPEEEVRYRVRLIDYQQIGKPVLYLEHFSRFEDADAKYGELCEDKSFIRHHKDDLIAEMQKAYRGYAEVFWETIQSSVIYDDSE